MEWTRSKPTKPGLYWHCGPSGRAEAIRCYRVLYRFAEGLVVDDGEHTMALEKFSRGGYWQRIERPAPPHVEEEQC